MITQLNDQDLSLEVARIMWPEYEWFAAHRMGSTVLRADNTSIYFDHTTDDALGKMAVWFTCHLYSQEYSSDEILFKSLCRIADCLRRNDRHRAIAEAIVETKGGEG